MNSTGLEVDRSMYQEMFVGLEKKKKKKRENLKDMENWFTRVSQKFCYILVM